MKRAIQRLISDPLSLKLINGDYIEGDTIVVTWDGTSMTFTRIPAQVPVPVSRDRKESGIFVMTKNAIKTVLLLGGLTGLLLAGGELIGGRQGLFIGLAISILTSGVSYFFAEKIALATYSAQPVTETRTPTRTAASRPWSATSRTA